MSEQAESLHVIENRFGSIIEISGGEFSMKRDFDRDVWILEAHGRSFEFISRLDGPALCLEESQRLRRHAN